MVLSDGTTSSLLELFAELNPDKKVELSRFVNGKIDFSYRFLLAMFFLIKHDR